PISLTWCLLSSSSNRKPASFGGWARAGADTSSTNAAKTKSALMIVIPTSRSCNGKMRGCKLGQFSHVSSQECLQGHVLASRRLHQSPTGEHQGGTMIRWLVGAIGLSVVATHAVAADPIEI